MEVAMEIEDDLFFQDLSKQISLLIMDDDDEDPVVHCPSVSLQVLSGFLIAALFFFLTWNYENKIKTMFDWLIDWLIDVHSGLLQSDPPIHTIPNLIWSKLQKRKQRHRSFHSKIIPAKKEEQAREIQHIQHQIPKAAR